MPSYRILAASCCGLLLACGVSAQTVYESKSGQGKVYSDRPVAGGKPVELRPLNVIEATPVQAAPAPARVDETKPGPPAAAIATCRLPEAGGSVAANMHLRSPRQHRPLTPGAAHARRTVRGSRSLYATEMMIPPGSLHRSPACSST
jgi:hypothetical protein